MIPKLKKTRRKENSMLVLFRNIATEILSKILANDIQQFLIRMHTMIKLG